MAVPVKDDEGLVGEAIRGVIYFEGRTRDDCLQAIAQAFERIGQQFPIGTNYLRDMQDTCEVAYYSFEVEEGETGDGD